MSGIHVHPALRALLPAVVLGEAPSGVPEEPVPPVARTIEKIDVVHGDRRADEYHWLRDKEHPDVLAYLEAENAYAEAVMKPRGPLERALYDEMLARIEQTDLSVPARRHGFFYYSRTEEGRQYAILCRRKGSLDAPEEVLIDGNRHAEGHPFWSLGAAAVSDDGHLLAFAEDVTGFRQYTLRIEDLRTGRVLPGARERVTSVAWAADNRTLFYTTEDATTKRSNQAFRVRIAGEAGLAAEDGRPLYDEADERFSVHVERSRSDAYVFLSVGSLTTSEVRYLPASEPDGELQLVEPRAQDVKYDVDHRGDRFYIRVNDTGRNYRLVTAPVRDPGRSSWTELVAHRDAVMLEDVLLFEHHLVLAEREQALNQFTVMDLATGATHRIAFDEPVYSAFPTGNTEFETSRFRFSYQSLVTPASVFDYDVAARTRALLKQVVVLGGYDRTRYASERIHARADDGTMIPVSVVYRADVARDGTAPLHLNGYGAYGIPVSIGFSSNRLSLLDRGVVMAWAHVRGGGDLGKAWHDAGRMRHKMRTFTDFIAVADHLVARGYGARDRLVIEGGSAGGLLIGAVVNLRPDLAKAAVLQVPFVDVINTMLDESAPLTVAEFEEWGNPKQPADYAVMKAYCPYTNLTARAYPAMLVRTSLNDSQVMYWEPAKYVARLRARRTDRHVLLLKTNLGAGHGGASGRYDRLREIACDYAFMLWQMDVTER